VLISPLTLTPKGGETPMTSSTHDSLTDIRTIESVAPIVAWCPCGHAPEVHDAIATRYCGATIAGHLERGCICPAAAIKARAELDDALGASEIRPFRP
jgi:hypothetical protein